MCIDARLISQLWHINVSDKNNTCLHNCTYCYATTSPDIAQRRFKEHDQKSPILFGDIDLLLGKPSYYRVPIANENPKQGKLIM
jgi:wyosine [tRNA(Phe)-imidazoG37] synthetase (radical SAM superfamily)